MQSFGNGDRLEKRKVRSTECRKEALIRIRVRLLMNWRALASGGPVSDWVDRSFGGLKRPARQRSPRLREPRRKEQHLIMTEVQRSGCPINLWLEVLGDKWSLLIIRDMMFGNRRHFRELLNKLEEGISSNTLSDRLKTLLDEGIITRADDPTHKQKGIYSLTEQGIELLPILAQRAAWGYKYLPVTEELGIRAKLLSDGGPTMWAELMDELREIHLGLKPKRRTGPSVG
jgi:DNA-binding HxlR family transcriptional regulator